MFISLRADLLVLITLIGLIRLNELKLAPLIRKEYPNCTVVLL